ncbi:MAG: hypothetical protein IKV10_02890 [Alphaproteobacteria bacterium]|nr:hypothetical protein [Alphaproteobacteria bacterium]
MTRIFLCLLFTTVVSSAVADTTTLVRDAEQAFQASRIVCSGISDEIAKVANLSRANTAISVAGTVTAGGALVAGVKKNKIEEEIDQIITEMCNNGGCTSEEVAQMDDEQFFEEVIKPMSRLYELQQKLEESQKAGNWRTGLMAGTIGTNLASAIISGLNIDQSELQQHITACNESIALAAAAEQKLKMAGVNPIENPVLKKLDDLKTWCTQIDTNDVEKIEKRMKGVLGTSVAGTVFGAVGTGTSVVANSDKYMDTTNRVRLSDEDKKKVKNLNTTSNVMAGANVATGAVETGLNISLITLAKKLIANAERCEQVFE